MVDSRRDAVIVDAGGDGPVTARTLAEAGHSGLLFESGPFHGTERWSDPPEHGPGARGAHGREDQSSGTSTRNRTVLEGVPASGQSAASSASLGSTTSPMSG